MKTDELETLYLNPLGFFNEPPAGGAQGLPRPLMKAVSSRTVNDGWELLS